MDAAVNKNGRGKGEGGGDRGREDVSQEIIRRLVPLSKHGDTGPDEGGPSGGLEGPVQTLDMLWIRRASSREQKNSCSHLQLTTAQARSSSHVPLSEQPENSGTCHHPLLAGMEPVPGCSGPRPRALNLWLCICFLWFVRVCWTYDRFCSPGLTCTHDPPTSAHTLLLFLLVCL